MTHILVVDDDLAIRRLLQRALQREGYAADTAQDGEAAVPKMHQLRPDLVLLDLQMPRMDGWEFYAWLHGNGYSQVPVIVITAGERLELARQKLPEAEVLGKPFDLNTLLTTIQACLARGA